MEISGRRQRYWPSASWIIISIFVLLSAVYVHLSRATVVYAGLSGDANGDGLVNEADYSIWLSHFAQTTSNGPGDGDFNGDRIVDGIDYVIWLNAYGQTTTTPTPSPTPVAGAMWFADADTDVDNGSRTLFWGKEVASGDMTRLSIVTDPKGLYGKVYQAYITPAEITAGNKRAEFSQAYLGDGSTKLKLAVDSTPKGSTQNIYFGWRSLFGSDVYVSNSDPNDGNYMQLKGDSTCGGPAVGMTIMYGRLSLRSEQFLTEYNHIAWQGPYLTTLFNAWHTIVLHVQFSKDATIGYLETWFDGNQQTMMNGQTRIYFPTVCPNDTYIYPKLGVYSMDKPIGSGPYHWIESPRIGTTYDSVVPR